MIPGWRLRRSSPRSHCASTRSNVTCIVFEQVNPAGARGLNMLYVAAGKSSAPCWYIQFYAIVAEYELVVPFLRNAPCIPLTVSLSHAFSRPSFYKELLSYHSEIFFFRFHNFLAHFKSSAAPQAVHGSSPLPSHDPVYELLEIEQIHMANILAEAYSNTSKPINCPTIFSE